MAELLRETAAARPTENALTDDHGAQTWAELDCRVNRWVHVLRSGGLVPGDRVAVVAGNRRETFETVLACLHAGLTAVPVNWHLTASEIGYLLTDSGSRGVVADADRADAVNAALAQVAGVPPLRVVLGAADRESLARPNRCSTPSAPTSPRTSAPAR